MFEINGHRVEFFANGRIAVDGKVISLAINASNGGHYTYVAADRFAAKSAALDALAGAKLTGPGRRVGEYEADLAKQIVGAMF